MRGKPEPIVNPRLSPTDSRIFVTARDPHVSSQIHNRHFPHSPFYESCQGKRMAEQTENPILAALRRIESDIAGIKNELKAIKVGQIEVRTQLITIKRQRPS